MLSGSKYPQLSYLGPHSEIPIDNLQIHTHLDLLRLIHSNLSLNLKIDIINTCIDVSLLSFSSKFFKDTIDEESEESSSVINKINTLIATHGSKIFFFIGKDYFLGTQIESVIKSTNLLISKLSEIIETIGINYPSIMIRIGSAYGNRKDTMSVFCDRANALGKSTLSRLCVLNDDKPSLFSVTDLLSGVYYKTGIPICFRILPHHFNDGGLSIREALFLSSSTWKPGVKPVFIYGESGLTDECGFPIDPKTTEYLKNRIPTFGLDLNVIIDSPAKEDSCLKYKMDYKSLQPIILNRKN
jgi:UV DNA damage endonuclease